MKSEIAKKYLKRSEFSDVQADALAELLADQATHSDMRELRADFNRFGEKIESRMLAFEEKIEGRMAAFEEQMIGRMDAFEEKMIGRMDASERKSEDRFSRFEEDLDNKLDARFSKLEARLTWRLLVLVTFLGTVMTVVGAFLD